MRFKKLVLLSLLAVAAGVTNGQEGPINPQQPIGGDRDAHGCIGSAGYTWSALKNHCIRIWEEGLKLYPVEGGSFVDYMVWSDDKKSVEIFLTKGNPFIMKMDKPNSYSYKTYTLVTGKSTELRQSGKLIAADKQAAEASKPASGTLTVDLLEVAGSPGQVTFSQKGHTIFYYNIKTKQGLIKLNGKEYPTTDYKFNTNSYILTGDGITISAPKAKYKRNKGEDCMYGNIPAVTIKAGTATLKLTGVDVQDCPVY